MARHANPLRTPSLTVRASEALRAAEAWPVASSPDALAPDPGGILVLAPHPDDESLGCGGLIAECAAQGRSVRIVVLSDGAGSHPRSLSFPGPRLAALREEETRAAAVELGLESDRDLTFLRLPDGALPTDGAGFDAAVAAILRTTEAASAPAAVLTTWGHDPHRDHAAARAIGGAVARALPSQPKLFAYPVWGWAFAHPIPGFPKPPEPHLSKSPRGVRLSTASRLPAKRRAVAAHRSQTTPLIADDPSGFRLPPELLALAFRPFEVFFEESAAA